MPAPSEEIIFLNICWRTLFSFTLFNLLLFISILYLRFWSRDTLVYYPGCLGQRCVDRPAVDPAVEGDFETSRLHAKRKKKKLWRVIWTEFNQCLTKPRSKSFSFCPTLWSKHHLSRTISLKHIVSACSQTLYFLFKVRRARVIKEIKRSPIIEKNEKKNKTKSAYRLI